MNVLIARISATVVAAAAATTLAGCQPATPVATPAASTVTINAAPALSVASPDETFFDCAAPVFDLTISYKEAQDAAPTELAGVVAAGHDMFEAYQKLPAGVSVDAAATVAGLTADETAVLHCAVDAFGSGAA